MIGAPIGVATGVTVLTTNWVFPYPPWISPCPFPPPCPHHLRAGLHRDGRFDLLLHSIGHFVDRETSCVCHVVGRQWGPTALKSCIVVRFCPVLCGRLDYEGPNCVRGLAAGFSGILSNFSVFSHVRPSVPVDVLPFFFLEFGLLI